MRARVELIEMESDCGSERWQMPSEREQVFL